MLLASRKSGLQYGRLYFAQKGSTFSPKKFWFIIFKFYYDFKFQLEIHLKIIMNNYCDILWIYENLIITMTSMHVS